MHASGAIATKVAPFLPLFFWARRGRAGVERRRRCSRSGRVQIVTDILFSVKLRATGRRCCASARSRGEVAALDD